MHRGWPTDVHRTRLVATPPARRVTVLCPIDVLALPYGMPVILGNALGLTALPEAPRTDAVLAEFSLRRQGLRRPGTEPTDRTSVRTEN